MISIYLRLAVNAIKKNKVLYLPYIFATSLFGMIYYLFRTLLNDQYVRSVHGGNTTLEIVSVGIWVIQAFMVFFILYLSVFISRKRNAEYGVLSVLGMEKKHLIGLIFVENLIMAVGGIIVSAIGGVLLYKLFQAAFLKTLNLPIDNSWNIGWLSIVALIIRYLIIYVLVFIIQTVGILRKKTIDVIKSSSKGEKLRVIDYVIGAIGVVGLIIAYYVAKGLPSSFKGYNVAEIIETFAIDVIVVIMATFFFFAASSAVILTLLRKIKPFYYRKDNFIILSGLGFRMKRNGVGLASVCILFTMVIVSVAGLISFYSVVDPVVISGLGANLVLSDSFDASEEDKPLARSYAIDSLNELKEAASRHNVSVDYKKFDFELECEGIIDNGTFVQGVNESLYSEEYNESIHEYYKFTVVELENVLQFTSKEYELKENQIGIILPDKRIDSFERPHIDKVTLADGRTYEAVYIDDVTGLNACWTFWENSFLVLPFDDSEILNRVGTEYIDARVENAENDHVKEIIKEVYNPYRESYFVDFDADYYEQLEILNEVGLGVSEYVEDGEIFESSYPFAQAPYMVEFYEVYKGIIFVACAMIVMFIVMSILVLYYKNVFDAYDDLKNFQIMRKVGLEERLVRKCIYIQMIISTLLPILMASLHTLFAENFIKVLISMFEIKELDAFTYITVDVTIVSVVVYMVIGFVVSQIYLGIINRKA